MKVKQTFKKVSQINPGINLSGVALQFASQLGADAIDITSRRTPNLWWPMFAGVQRPSSRVCYSHNM